MKYNIFFVLLLTYYFYVEGKNENKNYRTIVTLFRHGDRNPTDTYPGDPYEEYFNHIGYGNLTNKGCKRLYKNGQKLIKIFPEIKSANKIKVISSNSIRCIKSAKCFIKGLIGFTWSDEIETVDSSENPMLNHYGVNCKVRNYSNHYDPAYEKLFIKYPNLIHNLSLLANYTYPVTDANWIGYKIIDPITSQYNMGLKMPKWFKGDFKKQSFQYMDDNFDALANLSIEKKLAGIFLKELISKFYSSPKDQLSFYGYSSHDSTLAPVMATVNAWTGKQPRFGESIIFTLTNDDQVKVYYFDQQHNLIQHIPFKCSEKNCSLNTFVSSVSNYIPEDWRKECQN